MGVSKSMCDKIRGCPVAYLLIVVHTSFPYIELYLYNIEQIHIVLILLLNLCYNETYSVLVEDTFLYNWNKTTLNVRELKTQVVYWA